MVLFKKILEGLLLKLNFSKKIRSNNKEEINQNSRRKTVIEKQQEFLNELKINSLDILNPKECKGNDFIKNILIALGVDRKLINNPIVFMQIKPYFIKMLQPYVLQKIENQEEFSEKEIQECIQTFFDKSNEYNDIRRGNKNGESLCIDKYGKIATANCIMGYKDLLINENYYAFSGNNLFVIKSQGDAKYSRIVTKEVFNPLGVLIEKEIREYKSKTEYISTRMIRDMEYPFIMHKKSEYRNEKEVVKNSKTQLYSMMNFDDCIDLNISGIDVPVDSIENIEEFYNVNKKQILDMFRHLSNLDWISPRTGVRKSDIIRIVEKSKIGKDYASLIEVREY